MYSLSQDSLLTLANLVISVRRRVEKVYQIEYKIKF